MEKLVRKIRIKGILKILFSLIMEFLLVFLITHISDLEIYSIIICFVLWTIVCTIYFVSGIKCLNNSNKNIKEYIKKSKYTKQELNKEFDNSRRFSDLYVGKIHVFAVASDGPHILQINDIQTVSYVHLGENKIKERIGYYYLYLKGDNIKDNIKIYYVSEKHVKEAVNFLMQSNDKIKLE